MSTAAAKGCWSALTTTRSERSAGQQNAVRPLHLAALAPLAFALGLLCIAVPPPAFTASLNVVVKDAKGQPVADAVVSLAALDASAPAAPTASGRIAIMQRDQQFLPYVTAVAAGTTVTFPNRDTVQHHVYSLSKAKKFELPLYDPGKAETIVFDQPGVVTLGCNIHDWMLAYLVVLPTPYFAQTDAAGVATVSAPAAGRYRLEIWHPRLAPTGSGLAAPVTQELTLGDSAPLEFSLTLKPDRRIRRAPEAKSGGYR